jgi:hypothetical protein
VARHSIIPGKAGILACLLRSVDLLADRHWFFTFHFPTAFRPNKWQYVPKMQTHRQAGMDKHAGDHPPPGFSLWDFYAAKRIYHGLEFFGAIDNFTDSRDPNVGTPLPIFRPELVS